MSYQEMGTLVSLATTLVTYAVCIVLVLSNAGSAALDESDDVGPLLWMVGVSIIASIGLRIAVEMAHPSESQRADVRDLGIGRISDVVEQWPLVAAGGRRAAGAAGAAGAGVGVSRGTARLDRQRAVPGVRADACGQQRRAPGRVPPWLPVLGRPTNVTNTIRTLRFIHGEMTQVQAQLAERVWVMRQTIIAIEQGRYAPS